jgi:pimeloyl-ACP methyl ester carboxylesterase
MRTPRAFRVLTLVACMTVGASIFAACSSSKSAAPTTSSTTAKPAATAHAAPARPAPSPAFVPAPVQWRSCGSVDCATVEVPLDYAHPTGPKVSLALERVRAKHDRIGSMLVNPGGPGAAGTGFDQDVALRLPSDVADRFDIIGWDPRGTGQSTAVNCGTKIDYLFAPDTAPDTPAELAQLEAASQRFANACEAGSAGLLAHISTEDSARDMDSIRAAIGDPKLTYLGFSYGTYLGAVYAQLFPQRVRALILDGALDPSLTAEQSFTQQAEGFQQSFDRFLSSCAESSSCPLHNHGDPRAAYDTLHARIERAPMHGSQGRTLGPTQLDIAVSAPLYEGASADNRLASELHAALGGDPNGLLDEFSQYMERSPDGSYSTTWPAFLAISCLDGPTLPLQPLIAAQRRAAVAVPDFGAANAGLGFPCAFWPVPALHPNGVTVSAPASPTIMVVGTTGDPATPYQEAISLTRQLGSARLVTVEGSSHTSLLYGNPCLLDAARRYLIDLVPPPIGLRCPA